MAYIHRARNPSIYAALGARGGAGWGWRLDRSHPLAFGLNGLWLGSGIVDAISPTTLTVGFRNLVTSERLSSNVAAISGEIGPLGPVLNVTGATGQVSTHSSDTSDFGAQKEITLAVVGALLSSTNVGVCALRESGTVRNSLGFTASGSLLPRYAVNYGSLRNVNALDPAWGSLGEVHSLVGVTRAVDDHELFVDGVSVRTGTANAGTGAVSRNQIIIGQTGGNNGRSFDFVQVACWERPLTSDEVAWWNAEPFAMLLPGGLE